MTITIDILKTALSVLLVWNIALTIALFVLNEERKLDIAILRNRIQYKNLFSYRGTDI